MEANKHAAAAAAAAKPLQSCPTLCDFIDGSPPGFSVPGILQARALEWVHFHAYAHKYAHKNIPHLLLHKNEVFFCTNETYSTQ